MFKKLEFEILDNSKIMWYRLDKGRQRRSDYKQRDEVKIKRKTVKREKCKKQDAFLHSEGTQYKSGEFHSK